MIVIKFLRDKKSKALRSQFVDIWENLPPEDKRDVFLFLFQAKQWKFFSELFLAELREGSSQLPWELLLSTFYNTDLSFPPTHKLTLQKYFKKFKISVENFNSFDDIIKGITLKKKYSFLQAVQHKKQDLLASAKIAKSEQLFDQQMSYLNKLKALFPNDINIREDIYQREKVNAEKVINSAARSSKNFSRKNEQLLEDEKPLIQDIKKQAIRLSRNAPSTSKDLAIMFRQFDHISDGIDFLKTIEDSNEKDWFLVDFLFSAKQYITLLNSCETLKNKYAQHPDSLFSISYIESLTYWELGEKSKAISLMQQIAQMKPNFKSAADLLISWQEESN